MKIAARWMPKNVPRREWKKCLILIRCSRLERRSAGDIFPLGPDFNV